ncbi:hypothetical protein [Acinetobacter courvalinii]|nr:hypothetical protein [Acinetobacter courvalinii]
MDELNNLPAVKVIALLSTTILIWYVAWSTRPVIHTLGSSTRED